MGRLAVAILLGLVSPTVARAQDNLLSTGSVLAGCRAFVENAPTGDMMQMGACAGAVAAVMDVSRTLRRACTPPSIGLIEATRTVIRFADANPQRQSNQFGSLALAALSDRWPC